MLPEFTIIICTRNGAARLPDALKSLNKLELSNEAVEIVIVDNGSSDDTALVVRQAQRQSPQCIHYIFEPRPGLSVARNQGIAFASGKLVAFIDDDAEVTRFLAIVLGIHTINSTQQGPSVVSCIKWPLRAPQKFQVKAQSAVNGRPLNQGCNAGLELLWGSLRARREGIICCVAPLGKDPAIPCETRLAANTFSSRLIVT